MFLETVNKDLMSILKRCMEEPSLNDFVLVGGTSLSLQRGHRISVDIDLFTCMEYGTMPLEQIRKFYESRFDYVSGLDDMDKCCMGYSLLVRGPESNNVKVDMFYTDRFLFPHRTIDNIRLADERDIGAMKMLAITHRDERIKDYWDIYELTEDYSLSQLIKWGLERHPYDLELKEITEKFQNIWKLDDDIGEILSIKKHDWQVVRMELEDMYKMEEQKINSIPTLLEDKERLTDVLREWTKSRRTLLPMELNSMLKSYTGKSLDFSGIERPEQKDLDAVKHELYHDLADYLSPSEQQKIREQLDLSMSVRQLYRGRCLR